MQKKWSELGKKEKILFIINSILAVALLFFVVADVAKWPLDAEIGWLIVAGLMLAVECIGNWNKRRKLAILELAGSVVTLAIGALCIFVK